MKKALSVVLLCAGASLCVVPVAQAHQTAQANWMRMADDDSSVSTSTSTTTSNGGTTDNTKSEGTIKKCIKWVQKEVRVWVKDHYEVRQQSVCLAVRG